MYILVYLYPWFCVAKCQYVLEFIVGTLLEGRLAIFLIILYWL